MPREPAHPSVLNRVARRLGGALRRAMDGLAVLREEARHPGRPQPHRVGRNPLWRDDDDRLADAATPSRAYTPGGDRGADPFARPEDGAVAGDDAWYLRGDEAGWTATNPEPDEDE